MGTAERRTEIMRILCRRRHETISNLAETFGVSRRTIQRDVEILSITQPLYTQSGSHSVDKMRCLEEGLPYWEDEMPSDTVKTRVEARLNGGNNRIYGMMTHTCPIDYLPTEMFMSTHQNTQIKRKPRNAKSKQLFKPDIDRSTENWLGTLEQRLDYTVWYCGHYHIDKCIDKIHMMYHEIQPLHNK